MVQLPWLSGCTLKPRPKPAEADERVKNMYAEAVARLPKFLEDKTWVVSRNKDGGPEDQGDSLIETGIALAALPCDGIGHEIALNMADDIVSSGGELRRHPSLMNQISIDGFIGLYRGIAARIKNCGESDVWSNAIAMNYGFIKQNDGRLNNSSPVTVGLFEYPIKKLAGVRVPEGAQVALVEAMTEWGRLAVSAHSACFRVNLAYLTLRTLDDLGHGPNALQRSAFCAATHDSGIALISQFCGFGGIQDFIDNFKFNEWNYKFSRCQGWEMTPDSQGFETPAVDLLIGIKESFSL